MSGASAGDREEPSGPDVFQRDFPLSYHQPLADAGRIDGCTDLGVSRHIRLPLSTGTLGTLLICSFMTSWNDRLILYLMSQRRLVEGITVGAVRG